MTWQDKFQNALAYQGAGRLDAAERAYRATIAGNPSFAAAHHNLGTVLHLRGRYRQAIHAFQQSAKLDPELEAAAHLGIGVVLTRTGDFVHAEEELRAAIALAPNSPDPHRFLGDMFRNLGRLEEARTAFLRALSAAPDDPEAHFGLACVCLALGEMPEGWGHYEYRRAKVNSPALEPVWRGEDIAGRTVLIHSEQGLGDTFQFLRYIPHLAAHRATVLLAARHEIMALAATVPGISRIVEPTYTLPRFDFSCALPSLPYMFATTLATIPDNVPYLQADPTRVAAWQEKLGKTDGLTVAIAWRGNPEHRNDYRRSILDGEIAPLLNVPNVRFLVVQKDDADAPNMPNVVKLGAQDFNEVAAIMTVADLTISVDTVFCHLAGALGRPVWTLLCLSPDWRWQLEGERTPWYPSMRLFRQEVFGDWAGVIRDINGALAEVPRRQA